jgi:hypothetical protein
VNLTASPRDRLVNPQVFCPATLSTPLETVKTPTGVRTSVAEVGWDQQGCGPLRVALPMLCPAGENFLYGFKGARNAPDVSSR